MKLFMMGYHRKTLLRAETSGGMDASQYKDYMLARLFINPSAAQPDILLFIETAPIRKSI